MNFGKILGYFVLFISFISVSLGIKLLILKDILGGLGLCAWSIAIFYGGILIIIVSERMKEIK